MSDLKDPFNKFFEDNPDVLINLPFDDEYLPDDIDSYDEASSIEQLNNERSAYYLRERGVFTRWMLKGKSEGEIDRILDYLPLRGKLFLKLEKKHKQIIDKIFIKSNSNSDDVIKTLIESFIRNKDSKTLHEIIFFLVEEFNILNFELMVSKLINENNYSSKDFGEEFEFLLVDAKPKEERESFLFIQWSSFRVNMIINHLIQKFDFKLESYFRWLISQQLRPDLEANASLHPFTQQFISNKLLPSPNSLKKSTEDEES